MFVSGVDYIFKANAQMDHGMMGNTGTALGMGVFHSNGDRIDATAISDRGAEISYTGKLGTLRKSAISLQSDTVMKPNNGG